MDKSTNSLAPGSAIAVSLCCFLSAALFYLSATGAKLLAQEPAGTMMIGKSWRDLQDEKLTVSPHVRYFEFKLDNGSKAHLIVVDTRAKAVQLRPFVNGSGCPTSQSAAAVGAIAAVNGGYFNLSNGLSTSFVVLGGKVVCDPRANPALIGNPHLAPFMSEILNRTEVRFGHDKDGKSCTAISKHDAPSLRSLNYEYSLQAGPRLLPDLTAEAEAFVRKEADGKEVDAIGVHKPAARTAFGLTDDGHALILCVSGGKQEEFSTGVTLPELSALMRRLGCVEAMNFDGGTSTTMVVSLKNESGGSVPKLVCGKLPETRVKSVLLVVSAQK